jgi:hypothetical protein
MPLQILSAYMVYAMLLHRSDMIPWYLQTFARFLLQSFAGKLGLACSTPQKREIREENTHENSSRALRKRRPLQPDEPGSGAG